MIIYVVSSGDSVYAIAQKFGVPMERILRENGLSARDPLVIGQSLVIMTEAAPHTVRRGQSLYSIARSYGVTLDAVRKANPQIADPSALQPGQIINIPGVPHRTSKPSR